MACFIRRLYRRVRHVPGVIAERSNEGDADKGGVHPEFHPLGVLFWCAMTRHVARLLAWSQAWQHLHYFATCLHGCKQHSRERTMVSNVAVSFGWEEPRHCAKNSILRNVKWTHASGPHARLKHQSWGRWGAPDVPAKRRRLKVRRAQAKSSTPLPLPPARCGKCCFPNPLAVAFTQDVPCSKNLMVGMM